MAVKLNPDKEVVARIKEGLRKKDGYCPCRVARTPENKCIERARSHRQTGLRLKESG